MWEWQLLEGDFELVGELDLRGEDGNFRGGKWALRGGQWVLRGG